jgi:hypothetical protein
MEKMQEKSKIYNI